MRRIRVIRRIRVRNLILTCIVLFLSLTLGGCSPRKLPALGSANDLTIVTNVGTEDESLKLVKSAFEKDIVTVGEEKVYVPEVYPANRLSKYSNSRNLILLTDLSRGDAFSKKVRGLLGKKVTKQITERAGGYFVFSNMWALGQTLAIVAGADRERLAEVVRTRGEELFSEMDSVVTERTKDVLYLHGEQNAMSRYLSSKYAWSLRIPKGFRVAEDEKGRLVKLVGDEPARLLFVYWKDAEEEVLDPAKCLKLRSDLAWTYYDEDVVEMSMTTAREALFLGRKAVKIQGVWQNDKYVIGGPFFTYCFLERDRLYVIDCVVFAPGMSKAPFLKQLEAIALTFKDERKGT